MKIFMYSDLHISKTSSILPQTDGKYSYRQQMIMATGKWLSNLVKDEKPDIIINLGDTFDQHTITSYDIDTASEFFGNFKDLKVPHIVLVGNHEMVNKDFNAISLLKHINNIIVIDEPSTINLEINGNGDPIPLAFLPYQNWNEIKEFPKGKFLFSHIDIKGSSLRRDSELKDGLELTDLAQYILVFNGHIHKSSIRGNVVNVGSITSHSFSDDEDTIPTAYIFDTNTMDLKQFKSIYSPLFRRVTCNTIDELKTIIEQCDKNYVYCINCVCPFEIKNDVKSLLDEFKNVISYRLNITVNKEQEIQEQTNSTIQTNLDIIQTFRDFLNSTNTDLKYPKQYYIDILNNM